MHALIEMLPAERGTPATPAIAASDAEAIEALRRAVTYMIASRAEHDLTQRQLGTLLLVTCTEGPHTIRGIAQKLDLLKPAVTRAVDVLQAEALVERRPDPADRRSVLVVPTAEALRFTAQLVQAMREG